MKRIPVCFLVVLIYCGYVNSQSDWQLLNSGVTVNLHGVHFTDHNTGYACGSGGTIIKTTNGGLNWDILPTGSVNQLNKISFADDSTGYCCGNNILLKTSNSGNNWFTVFSGATLTVIQCVDSTVYCGGFFGVYRSMDRGQTWNNTMTGFNGIIWGMYFVNELTGYAMGNSGTQKRTSNGGLDWSGGLFWGPGEYTFSDCQFFNSGSGFVSFSFYSGAPNFQTSYGIYKANDWFSWHLVYSSPNMAITGITFTGNDTAFAVGGGWTGSQYQSLISKSTNGGNNWIAQSFAVDKILRDVCFLDSKTGYIVGNSGAILKTENGGVTSAIEYFVVQTDNFYLSQNYPNPFNPSTKISYILQSAGFIELKVYDVAGRFITSLVNANQYAGSYETELNAADLSGGIYFYSLTADGRQLDVKRMALVK